jgi:hypothetical protein
MQAATFHRPLTERTGDDLAFMEAEHARQLTEATVLADCSPSILDRQRWATDRDIIQAGLAAIQAELQRRKEA